MNYKILFQGQDGEPDLAAARLARECSGEPSVTLPAQKPRPDAEAIERGVDVGLVVGIVSAGVGAIHLARFIYDILQQRKVEVSITDEFGITYKFRRDIALTEIEKKLTQATLP